MTSSQSRSPYWQGFRDGLPFLLVIAPFGLLFGVVATEAGLSVFETLTFSVVVIAGAAQFTALQLMSEHAPTAIVLASALAVNLRMAMYSASLTPHIGAAPLWKRAVIAYFTVDQSYACSIVAYEENPSWSVADKTAYFMGTVTPICPMWYGFTLLGSLIGSSMPSGLALDFAIPITFLAIIAPALRTPAHRAAALASVVLSLAFSFFPYNLGVLVAGLGAMMIGAQVELWQDRRNGDA
ncbi:Inner membrane protein YgaZ [Thalassovita gelatinovora]|uniref:Inner membrane protein YgaZ n=1 Tax=Thalassovita gelatinovora TaxID=53501 RepID=A0A0P1FGS7_THAGE|nr:AzlC family ABC transporter permease [Thalassovita gelatinovora]QIZ81890.1 AzlC family ABC transporter permease [Thalassovita gelatinovora]CUH67228.1 Inner membrane protein YgaZ [Thalassovita gelatinovora]SEP78097.1 Predicted branched-chain amino acid permease (azaleucine resistance) [Thalassovita gelatinovora]